MPDSAAAVNSLSRSFDSPVMRSVRAVDTTARNRDCASSSRTRFAMPAPAQSRSLRPVRFSSGSTATIGRSSGRAWRVNSASPLRANREVHSQAVPPTIRASSGAAASGRTHQFGGRRAPRDAPSLVVTSMPCAVKSKTQASTIAIGKPAKDATSTARITQAGALNAGKAIEATCTTVHAAMV